MVKNGPCCFFRFKSNVVGPFGSFGNLFQGLTPLATNILPRWGNDFRTHKMASFICVEYTDGEGFPEEKIVVRWSVTMPGSLSVLRQSSFLRNRLTVLHNLFFPVTVSQLRYGLRNRSTKNVNRYANNIILLFNDLCFKFIF